MPPVCLAKGREHRTLLGVETHVRSLGARERDRVLEAQAAMLYEKRNHDDCAAATTGLTVHVGSLSVKVHLCVNELDAAVDRLDRGRREVVRGAKALLDIGVQPVLCMVRRADSL